MTRDPSFLAAVADLLGPRGFTTDPELLDPWLTDWRGRFTGKALGLASPASTQEVSALVKLCAAHEVPIVPQGGNSGMSGGATPDTTGKSLILSLRRMNDFGAFDVKARQITCGAGVILQTLHERVAEQGLRFPLTLGGKGSATIGGLISTNAGGTQVLRHGTMRAQVLGLEAVMADGSVLDTLTPLKKDNRGFDLKQLLIGSEGTLGIVTAATLQLLPQIGDRRVIWAGLTSIQKARELLLHCEAQAPDFLEGFEVLPNHSLEAVLAHLPDARSPVAEKYPWHALIELTAIQGESEPLTQKTEALMVSAFEADLVEDAVISANETQAEAFWLLRDSIAPAERAIGPAMQHDIAIPVPLMADFIEKVSPEIEDRFPGTTTVAFGHLGDGNVHFHVLAPKGADPQRWEAGEAKEVSGFVHDKVSQWGGSISAEHGIGQVKRDELGRLGDPARLALMRNIKAALDPKGIMNPGKLVPLAKQAATT
ncbi:FAD-binding oxidoreductase [Qipengyuania sp. GH1]|uniref:FAD-binding oxidoreductase n=1 Tax=Qipengyuania aestuarii TaxID=2867241 RepID=UPI001C867ADF|nr:FAD-binding oxidoreductase [Qipengyuania aestuarii]MBX7534174.1 FAD-binding oxidoreductase [Qipengyuania aestuarii]